MSEEKPLRWYARFVHEWAHRFGFLSIRNEHDSVESIDEVANILASQRESLDRRIDDLEAALAGENVRDFVD